jgi:hypothetical protein
MLDQSANVVLNSHNKWHGKEIFFCQEIKYQARNTKKINRCHSGTG